MMLARVPRDGGTSSACSMGVAAIAAVTTGGAHVAIVQSTPTHPNELFAVDGDSARQLSDANPWLREDSARRSGAHHREKPRRHDHPWFSHAPLGVDAHQPLPTILRLHGGPVSQWENGFELSWQMLAAHGFAVLGMNPRGSSGRGLAWAKSIFAHWGEKDVQDVLSGVDYLVAHGIADPAAARRWRLELWR